MPFFAYVFGKTKKASEPRQGMKQGMHQEQKNTPAENEKGTDPKAHPSRKKMNPTSSEKSTLKSKRYCY